MQGTCRISRFETTHRDGYGTCSAADMRSVALMVVLGAVCWTARAEPLAARSFGVQLHGYPADAPERLGRADRDLIVVDPDRDDPDESFSPADVARMRGGGPGGRAKRVLAYLSIGEAEPYRRYFDPRWVTPDPRTHPRGPFRFAPGAPGYLHSPNPDWPDNFKVRFWDPAWQRVVLTSLDRVLAAGFDGVYLDIVDAYEFFGPKEDEGNGERPGAARDMLALVERIAAHARATRPGFLMVPQNGSGILEALDDEALAQRYLNAVDGIGVESAFHYGPLAENNPADEQGETVAQLERFRAAGKAVLAIEYLAADRPNPKRLPVAQAVDAFRRRARALGFVPTVAIRSLDRLSE